MIEPSGGAGSALKRGSNSIGETQGLTLAALLAALAGMVDVLGYLHLSGLFISLHER